MQDKQLQLEDTVSADRKERIIYVGPGKTRKISSITSRQNFNNEKFTRKKNKGEDAEEDDEKEQVDEGTIQPSGDSKVEAGAPTQSDVINQDKKKKSNSPQIEFVTGTEKAGSSSTTTGNAQMNGIKKISEALVKEAMKKVKGDDWDDKNPPFDPDTKVEKEFKKPHNPNRSPMDTVRALAQKAMNKQKGVKEEVEIEEAIRITDPARKKLDPNFGKKDGSFQSDMERKHLAAAAKDRRKVTAGSGVSGFNSKMVKPKSDQDTGRVRATNEEVEQIDELSVGAKAKLNKEGTEMKTYQEFLDQLLEYTPGPGGVTRVQGRSYGAQYHDPEGDDDADDRAPAAKPADAPKRGRGRPAGSKSGANQKVTTGKSYGGIATHSLHLPNSK